MKKDRFTWTAYHGEGRTLYYIVDNHAPVECTPEVIKTYRNVVSAKQAVEILNRED